MRALKSYDDSRAQQEEKRLPLLSWQELIRDCHDSANEKLMDSLFTKSPFNFIFPL